jgi:tungstate transport system permease protein
MAGAISLIGSMETWRIIFLSFRISAIAALLALGLSIPFSLYLAKEFERRKSLVFALQVFLFVPTVTLGVFLYTLLSRTGPLGFLGLLYTPGAMIAGQAVLVFPLVSIFLLNGLHDFSGRMKDSALTLGAEEFQYNILLLKEAKFCLLSAFIVGLSRAVGETGLAIIVGGNIEGSTRVVTTAIALHSMRGDFELALSLGLILLAAGVLLCGGFILLERK